MGAFLGLCIVLGTLYLLLSMSNVSLQENE